MHSSDTSEELWNSPFGSGRGVESEPDPALPRGPRFHRFLELEDGDKGPTGHDRPCVERTDQRAPCMNRQRHPGFTSLFAVQRLFNSPKADQVLSKLIQTRFAMRKRNLKLSRISSLCSTGCCAVQGHACGLDSTRSGHRSGDIRRPVEGRVTSDMSHV